MLEKDAVTKIQSTFRGYLWRRNNLPNSINFLQQILMNSKILLSKIEKDGRVNSNIDETILINILEKEPLLQNRLYIPSKCRHWFDIGVKDYKYGWLPINIKSTTTLTSDNTGNLAMCVYSFTSFSMDLKKPYQNGQMAKILIEYLKNNKLNKKLKRDYYFLVVNKNNPSKIIVNSIKGLRHLTPNINNLPFQIKWNLNEFFIYKPISNVVENFVKTIKKPKLSWREEFLTDIRKL